MEYDKYAYFMNEFTTWKSYWSNADEWNCPVNNCTLFEKDCEEKLISEHISMSASFPYTISGKLGVAEGYNHSVCIKCNVNQTISTIANYEIR
jgi:hypothetical protein